MRSELPDKSNPYYEWAKQLASRKLSRARGSPKAAAESEWLKLPDAAPLLGISAKTLRKWCHQGLIEHKREGTRGRGGQGTFLIHRKVIERHNVAKARKVVQEPQRTVTPIKVRPKPVKLRHLDPNWARKEPR